MGSLGKEVHGLEMVYVSAEISAFAVFPGHLAAPFSPLSPWC